MKITAVLLLAACMQVSAKGFTQTITINVKAVSPENVFKEIKKQTGLTFWYNLDVLEGAHNVDINVKNASVEGVMEAVSKNQPFTYEIIGNTVVIKKRSNPNQSNAVILSADEGRQLLPPIDVHGKIVNEKGEPVAATVMVKGTGKGTTTNDNGEFELKGISEDAVLVISGVSIESFEWKINGKTELILNAKVKTVQGENVNVIVNTGYQRISKERFVGSYSQLDSGAFARRAGMNIIDRLDGNVTGVLFDKKNPSVSQLRNIQIRGLSTLDNPKSPNREPLIIVDNFPYRQDISNINPNDVESVIILRDAAATSIWGAQAGNGVIVITTKKAKYNQAIRVSVNSNFTIDEKPNQWYYPQMAIADFIDAEIFLFDKGKYDGDIYNTTSWPALSPVVELLANKRAGRILDSEYNWQIGALKNLDLRRDLSKYAYRNASLQQHYINVSGGNTLFNFSLSGGYNGSLNNIKNSRPDDQFTINSVTGIRPFKNAEITTTINYSQNIQRGVIFTLPGQLYPYAQLADAEGHSLVVPFSRRQSYIDTAGGGSLLDWAYRPLAETGFTNRKDITRFIGLNLGISYRITSWLSAVASYQFNNQLFDGRNFYSLETYYVRDLVNQFTNLSQTSPDLRNPIPKAGILDINNTRSAVQNARGQLNFNKSFNRLHKLNALAAAEISETKGNGNSERMYGYNQGTGSYKSTIDYVTNFPMYGISSTQRIVNGNISFPESNNRFVSFVSNLSYTFDERYSFYASARKDGSNVFGVNTNKKWKPLWSAGGSWNISNESFYHLEKWLPLLRFRTSYGFTGNPGNATGLPTIAYSTNPASFTNLPIAFPSDAPNPDLRWEKVKITNAGIEFNVSDNRLSGSVDVWHKKSTDVISSTPFAPSTGITTFTVNVADLKGTGYDITLNSKQTIGFFEWRTNFGLSHAKTIVTKLFDNPSSAKDFIGYSMNASEGRLAYGIASYRWAGLDPQTGDPLGFVNKQVSRDYGAIANDSVGNQVFHGSAIPLYFGFISNSFNWKNFTLSANITYRFDFYFRKPTINYTYLADDWIGHSDYELRWKNPGDEKYTTVPSFTYPLDLNRDLFYAYAEPNVLRGDNIRLQDIRLQYNFDNSIQKKRPFKSLQLFFYANNLNAILWRKNKSDLDPDFVGGQSFIIPTPKSWTIGLNTNF